MARTFKIVGSGIEAGFQAYGTVHYVCDDAHPDATVIVALDDRYETLIYGKTRCIHLSRGGMLFTDVGEADVLRVALDDLPAFCEEIARWEMTNLS